MARFKDNQGVINGRISVLFWEDKISEMKDYAKTLTAAQKTAARIHLWILKRGQK